MSIGKYIRFQRSREASKAAAAADATTILAEQEEQDDQSPKSMKVNLGSSSSSNHFKARVSTYALDGSSKPLSNISGSIQSEVDTEQQTGQNDGFGYLKRAGKTWSTIASLASEPRSPSPSLFEEEQTLSLEVPVTINQVDSTFPETLPEPQLDLKSDAPIEVDHKVIELGQAEANKEQSTADREPLPTVAVSTTPYAPKSDFSTSKLATVILPDAESVKRLEISIKAQDALLDHGPDGSRVIVSITRQSGASVSTLRGGVSATLCIEGTLAQIDVAYELLLIHSQKYPIEDNQAENTVS
ncbi:hypothetical protein LZ554_006293 [Drepanopeziza brunnea f. sp. 'monogermtubi']|nr:hypothetical protein LZ554_006293 [Drepanopeziza brunnea f. sp. 'monogermtubi']